MKKTFQTKLGLSIGILSWKGYESLFNSLKSYEKNGLSDFVKEKFICLPEYSEEGIKLAKKFKYEPILVERNLGILGGFKLLAEKMPKGPVLLLENDLELIENRDIVFNQLKRSIELLSLPRVIQVRLRSRKNPGEPFVGLEKYKNYWSSNLISYTKRIFRPNKAKKLIGTSVYHLNNPVNRHPGIFQDLSNGFYIVSSSFLNWSNLAILVDRDKYLNTIIKKAEDTISKKRINGFKNIEIELNSNWWREQNRFDIVIAPGLFSHNRLYDRGY